MSLFRFLRPVSSAPVARERLQILLEYERRMVSQSALITTLHAGDSRRREPARLDRPGTHPRVGRPRRGLLDAGGGHRDTEPGGRGGGRETMSGGG